MHTRIAAEDVDRVVGIGQERMDRAWEGSVTKLKQKDCTANSNVGDQRPRHFYHLKIKT